MKRKAKDRVEAEVLLRPAPPEAGEAASKAGSARRAGASQEVVEKVADRLRALGFKVTAQSGTSISISGPGELFEKVFKAGAQAEELSVPADVNEHVEGVYVQSPPTYFDT